MRRQHWIIACGSALGLGGVVLLATLGRAAADPAPIPGDSARSPSDAALPRAAEPREDWGEPVGGLQVGIAPAEPGPARDAGAPEFLVSLRNAGAKALTLNLGVMLSSGDRILNPHFSSVFSSFQ
jgi:hypothetical protein